MLYAEAAAAQEKRLIVDPWKDILESELDGLSGTIATEKIFERLGVKVEKQDGNVGQRRLTKIMGEPGFAKTKRRHLKRSTPAYTNQPDGEATSWLSLTG